MGNDEDEDARPVDADVGRDDRGDEISLVPSPNGAGDRYEVLRGGLTVPAPAPTFTGILDCRRSVLEPDSSAFEPDPEADDKRPPRVGPRAGDAAREVPKLDGSDSRCDSSPWLVDEAPLSSSWYSTLVWDAMDSLLATRGSRLDRLTDLEIGIRC